MEIELTLPLSEKKRRRAIHNFDVYVTSLARKNRLKVNGRRLTPEERARFKEAKAKELKSYIKHSIIEALPKMIQSSKGTHREDEMAVNVEAM